MGKRYFGLDPKSIAHMGPAFMVGILIVLAIVLVTMWFFQEHTIKSGVYAW